MSRAQEWWIARRGLVGVMVCTVAVVATTVFLLGWFQETATQLRCEGGPDRAVACTVTTRYRLRTTETLVTGVTGVAVRERSIDGDEYHWLQLLTASGPSGPALTWDFSERVRAAREADRLAEAIAVAPGTSVAGQTRPPQPGTEAVAWLGFLALDAALLLPILIEARSLKWVRRRR